MPIKIHYPLGGTKTGPKFVAFGLASSARDLPISGVIGKLTDTAAGGKTIYGKTAHFRGRKGRGPGEHSWAIVFTDAVEGTYTLTVTGVLADGTFTEQEQSKEVVVLRHGIIEIRHPMSDTTLTVDEKEYFLAWGVTSGPTVLAVSASLGAVEPDSMDTYPSEQIWWATFPPLTMGCYTFTVVDSENHSATSTNVCVP